DDRQDELGQLNRAIAELASISQENDRLLSQTETRARQLQTSAEVSRAAASILDVSELLPRVVDLIRDAFGYDHVQVFLMDEGHKNALLRASTGPVGQKMLSLKWSLPVGSESVIGQVTANAQPVIALDTADARFVHRPNPHLPDTRSEMALPLVSRGRVIGALDVQSKQPNAFFDEDVRVLTTLADQIAIALDNASLFQQTQNYTLALTEQVHNLQELLEASQALSAMLDPQDILNAACEDMARLLAADHVGIVLAQEQDPRRGNMIADYPDLGIRGAEVEVEGAWWHDHYSKTSQPVVVQDVTTSELITEETRRALLANNIQQLVLVPFLVSAGQVRGSIGIDMYTSGRVFTLEDLTLLQLFATQVASAYQNALSFAWTQRQAEEMAFLFQVTTAAAEVTELESCMQTVLQELQHALPNDVLAAYMTNPDTASFECVASLSESSAVTPAERIPMSSWISRQALSGRRPFLLPDIHQQENAYGLPATPLRSLIVAPLFSGSSVVGLVVALKHEPNAYNESNLRLLQALSGSISAVVENIRLLDEVRAINNRLREVDKIKSQFLANMSHELRTPLNSIIGFSRVILKGIDGPLTDMQTQDLETIHSSGQHLLNLINDILDQAKIEADKLSINMNWFAIDSVIEVARSMSIGLLKDRPVRLNVETEPNLPKLWGDEIRTRQVLLNLLSNAAKFTFEGAITISAFQIEREDGPYVQISVADTGIGIPEDSLDKIFVAFEQVDGSLTRASGGTGLGLPISRSLIAMMGGELWVESTVNVGSTFNFYIPAFAKQVETDDSDDEQPEAQIDEAAPAFEQQMLPRRTMVMVIDSEVGLHQHYRRHLNAVGYTVEATAASHQAVELARQFQPDMVVFDVRTPEGDGWETLEHLRAYPETAQIPVIVCSAEIDEARLHQMGIAAWLPKPLQAGRLQAAVREVEAQHVHDRVLIVDDRPETVRLILETLREQERYYIQTATSGQQALDLIARKRPDLVLLDLNMPDLDGLTVLEQLRSNPRTHHIPVLIITAEDEMAAELQGRMGAVDVFSKNEADPAQLLSGVQTLLKESNGQPAGGTHA
ncbi:MAG: GAF domain-containing protein, partial [Anaerolineae bacterium]|nr:GAF domain-containing protein [Anaerolineae bacterium]